MPPPNGFVLAHHGPGQLESALPLGAGLATGCIHWELGAAVAGEGVQHLPFSSSSNVPTGVAFALHSPGHHPGASGVTDVAGGLDQLHFVAPNHGSRAGVHPAVEVKPGESHIPPNPVKLRSLQHVKVGIWKWIVGSPGGLGDCQFDVALTKVSPPPEDPLLERISLVLPLSKGVHLLMHSTAK